MILETRFVAKGFNRDDISVKLKQALFETIFHCNGLRGQIQFFPPQCCVNDVNVDVGVAPEHIEHFSIGMVEYFVIEIFVVELPFHFGLAHESIKLFVVIGKFRENVD